MYLKSLHISGFKSFAHQYTISFDAPIASIVGPNGSGKSNIAEAFRFVLGEQSIKSLRGKKGSDLIYSGQQGGPRVNRASVKVVFDNASRSLAINFDEVVIERVVHRDGINEYFINSSSVRLKDITELLSGAHIGSSGHHIISQGEADRVLNASQKERRAILEDALGLRQYQYKIAESERKLKKTEQNIGEVELLRREITPHLKFLKKQVEKIEEGKILQKDLTDEYHAYLAHEEAYLRAKRHDLETHQAGPKSEATAIKERIIQLEESVQKEETDEAVSPELESIEFSLAEKRQEQQGVYRSLGQLEGEMRSLVTMLERLQPKQVAQNNAQGNVQDTKIEDVSIRLSILKEKMMIWIDSIKNAKEGQSVADIAQGIEREWNDFVTSYEYSKEEKEEYSDTEQVDVMAVQREEIGATLKEIEQKKAILDVKLTEIAQGIFDLSDQKRTEEQLMQEKRGALIEAERSLRDEEAKLYQAQKKLEEIHHAFLVLQRDEEDFRVELDEASALLGHIATHYSSKEISNEAVLAEDRGVQHVRKRDLEKKKIKYEELGMTGGADIVKEHAELAEREVFLVTEIEDLQKAASDVRTLIDELQVSLQKEFALGITKITKAFSEYFTLMFGGGEASLMLTEESSENEEGEIETKEGIEIAVNLPRKKIRDLMMLSGGERALTSIALLFAMSSVNPPPFIILDETDAALDEANSRKYGDMIENLAKQSQLILITHNRETMSRAGVLYGVTMGSQGASSVLSIKFDDAVKVAK